jgi:hypothetical protein
MITNCIHCGCFIETRLGEDPPAAHQGNAGTSDDPRAPGEYDDICDDCNYNKGLRGGKSTITTYNGDHTEWRDND